MFLLGRCLNVGRFCASSEPQIAACSILLCRLAFPFPFVTPGNGILAQQLPILCGCVGARASRTQGEAPVWVSLPCWPGTVLLPSLFPYVCVLNILGLKVSFQVMAESQPFAFQPCLSHFLFPSLNWVTALTVEGSCWARHQCGTVFWICCIS